MAGSNDSFVDSARISFLCPLVHFGCAIPDVPVCCNSPPGFECSSHDGGNGCLECCGFSPSRSGPVSATFGQYLELRYRKIHTFRDPQSMATKSIAVAVSSFAGAMR